MATVFVTGGSGFVGSRLITRLLADGHTVRALARSDAAARKVQGLGAIPVRADLTDVAGLRAGREEPERTREAQDWMFTLIGLVAWNFAVPQLRHLILDDDDERAVLARRRAATIEAVRTLARHRQGAPT
jgi:nucleoside-diphosphate-sugar epimerase